MSFSKVATKLISENYKTEHSRKQK